MARWAAITSPYGIDGSRDERKIKEGWEREYILSVVNEGKTPDDKDWVSYPSREASHILTSAWAQAWIRQESTGESGNTLLPPGAGISRLTKNEEIIMQVVYPKEYNILKNAVSDSDAVYKRKKKQGWVARARELLGKKEVDYKEIRLIRTESAIDFNEKQRAVAEDKTVATGKVTRRLSARRDAWKCKCVEAAEWINKDGGKTPDEIEAYDKGYMAPLHPNCDCVDLPVMKSTKEVLDDIYEKYFGEEAMKKPVPEYEIPAGTFVNPEEKDDTINPLLERYKGAGLDASGLSELAPRTREKIIEAVEKVYENIPEAKGAVTAISIDTNDNDNLGSDIAGCYMDTGKIILNGKLYKDMAALEKKYNKGLASGFFPKGTDSKSAVVHESGHAINRLLEKKVKKDYRIVARQIKEQVLSELGLKETDIKQELSRYAFEGGHAEFISEAVSEALTSKHPRRVAMKVLEIIKNMLGGKI